MCVGGMGIWLRQVLNRQEREALNLAKEGREVCFRKSLAWVKGVAKAPMDKQTFVGCAHPPHPPPPPACPNVQALQ